MAGVFGSIGSLIEGVCAVGPAAKNLVQGIDKEIQSCFEDEVPPEIQKVEEAKKVILAKASAIKEIMEAIHCSATEAEELLNMHINK